MHQMHRRAIASNENKMSDGGLNRASLRMELWKSSQKRSLQRSAARSIAWLDLLASITLRRKSLKLSPLLRHLVRYDTAPELHRMSRHVLRAGASPPTNPRDVDRSSRGTVCTTPRLGDVDRVRQRTATRTHAAVSAGRALCKQAAVASRKDLTRTSSATALGARLRNN
jgi:hypothetical protein